MITNIAIKSGRSCQKPIKALYWDRILGTPCMTKSKNQEMADYTCLMICANDIVRSTEEEQSRLHQTMCVLLITRRHIPTEIEMRIGDLDMPTRQSAITGKQGSKTEQQETWRCKLLRRSELRFNSGAKSFMPNYR